MTGESHDKNPALSRRDALKKIVGGAAGAVAVAVAADFGKDGTEGVGRAIVEFLSGDVPQRDVFLMFWETLGLELDGVIKAQYGAQHPRLGGRPGESMKAAAEPLIAGIRSYHDIHVDPVRDLIQSDTSGSIFSYGSASSNWIHATLFGYEATGNGFVQAQTAKPRVVGEPVVFVLDEQSPGAGPHGEPNWGLSINGKTDRPSLAYGKILTDRLVITVAPNVLATDVETGDKIVSLAGLHGPGTAAAGMLLRHPRLVENLRDALKGLGRPAYWQAVVRVTELTTDTHHRVVPRTLDDLPEVYPWSPFGGA